ncbi:receptor-type tyrosine-protein phosphatase-like N [Pelodytes ibericus]
MRLCAGFLLCLMLLTCGPLESLGARNHGCLFDLRLCSKEESCVQDGLFGHCRERSERDVAQLQVTPGTLQQLQGVLRQLTAKGLSWRDDLTQRVMANEIGRIPQHRNLEALDILDEDRPSLPHTSGRTVQRLTGAGQPSAQRWTSSADKLQYFRPRLPSAASESALHQQRLPVSFQQNMSPLDRYLAYFLLSSQTPNSQFGYQDSARLRNPTRVFSASYTRPEGSRRLIYGRYQGGQEVPLTVHLPGERQHSWTELRRKLPRQSIDNEDVPDDAGDSSEGVDGINQITDGDQDPQGDSRTEAARTLRGSTAMQNIPDPQTEGLGDVLSLAAILDKYRVDLRQLGETQLEQLSYLLQLIQSDSQQNQAPRTEDRIPPKRVAEGEMQHMSESSPQLSLLEAPLKGPDTSNATAVLRVEQRNQGGSSLERVTVPTVSIHPENNMQLKAEQYGDLLEAISEAHGQKTMEKKNYQESEDSTDGQSSSQAQDDVGYIATDHKPLSLLNGFRLLNTLAHRVHLSATSFINISIVGPALTFQIKQNRQNLSLTDIASRAEALQSDLESETGVKIVQTGVGKVANGTVLPHSSHFGDNLRFVLLIFVALACIAGIVIASAVIFCIRQHAKQREKERLAGLGPEGAGDSTFEYQDLCRQHMAGKSLFSRTEAPGAAAENSRVSSVSSQFSDVPQPSPSSHSSTPSWCEEPVQSNMDISTGHMILAYMEDHLRNRDRLAKEWQALCAYQAEPNACSIAKTDANLKKNRNPDFVPYDHARIKLRTDTNPSHNDYINASPIIEHDPRMPAYIATQGPLSHTIADFWQMVWENGCTVIVMLSPLVEDGVKQCDRYWPDEGSSLYHIYEVNLVSEHIWCEDFLVRSFYLKNVQSQETRTLTQFHFLSWPAEGIPSSTRPLLDFRRKVNKSFRGRSCPIIAHCSDGAGRTGSYILIDMVLNRMAKGVKEIDIAASLEHVRDQRPGMVRTKDQFEFALTAVAEEVNAILKALPQ